MKCALNHNPLRINAHFCFSITLQGKNPVFCAKLKRVAGINVLYIHLIIHIRRKNGFLHLANKINAKPVFIGDCR